MIIAESGKDVKPGIIIDSFSNWNVPNLLSVLCLEASRYNDYILNIVSEFVDRLQ